jgi:hypothetical protein
LSFPGWVSAVSEHRVDIVSLGILEESRVIARRIAAAAQPRRAVVGAARGKPRRMEGGGLAAPIARKAVWFRVPAGWNTSIQKIRVGHAVADGAEIGPLRGPERPQEPDEAGHPEGAQSSAAL